MNSALPLLDRIADVAAACRAHQRDYFRTRSNEALRASKAAESTLDRLLAQREQEAAGIRQSSIFDQKDA